MNDRTLLAPLALLGIALGFALIDAALGRITCEAVFILLCSLVAAAVAGCTGHLAEAAGVLGAAVLPFAVRLLAGPSSPPDNTMPLLVLALVDLLVVLGWRSGPRRRQRLGRLTRRVRRGITVSWRVGTGPRAKAIVWLLAHAVLAYLAADSG